MTLRIKKSSCNFEREPLKRPFGFKGGYVKEIWQMAVLLEAGDGTRGWGLGTQSVLWSDSRVFASTSEAGGNILMAALTDRALQMIRDVVFTSPIDLMEQIFDELYEYACSVTGIGDLKKTFVLNALVPVDNAAWMLYGRKNRLKNVDKMIPEDYRPALSHRHKKIASIPISSYSMPLEEVVKLVEEQGYFILKFKLGSPGPEQEMLAQDMERLEQIHLAIGDIPVTHTKDSKLPYYLDINGRYKSKQTLLKLLDHAHKIGAFDQILLVEEPFPEELRVDVGDMDVMVAADESAHTADNVIERIEMGYKAIAVKAVAKTLSMTLKMVLEAHRNQIPCFCADLTVNPVLLEWNKNIAARLAPLPGLEVGLLETNGHQNYRDWERMRSYHPHPEASWTISSNGVFTLDEDFYRDSGGIFDDSPHYLSLLDDRGEDG